VTAEPVPGQAAVPVPTERPTRKVKQVLEYLETLSKIVGGISIPILGLAVTYVLHQQAETNQKAQLYANIMTGREKADSDVRAQMFSRLLDRYLVPRDGADPPRKGGATLEPGKAGVTLEEFRDRVMFLDLLRSNFEEYFNARALFARLYEQIREQEVRASGVDREGWTAIKQQLFEIAKDTTSRQVALLVRAGHLTEDIVVPAAVAKDSQPPVSRRIALYPTRGLRGLENVFAPTEEVWSMAERGSDRRDPKRRRYSITIRVNHILESSAKVTVMLYEDVFENDQFVPGRSLPNVRPIEFDVSYFSTPYMDNTRLFGGSRFSVIYDGCIDPRAGDLVCRFPLKSSAQPQAQFKVVVFDEAFLSQRDRPYVDQILEKLGTTGSW
jgi:hypothetical protein